MADPLGLYVGIVASLGTIIQLSEIVVEYLRNTVSATEEKEKLCTEILATRALLEKLHQKAGSPEWKHTLASMDAADEPLKRLESALQVLEAKAQPAKNRFRKVTKRFIWHFEKGEYVEILSKIQSSKLDFMTALGLYDPFVIGTYIISNSNEDLMTEMKALRTKFDSMNISRDGTYSLL
jgi:hypothetical protein